MLGNSLWRRAVIFISLQENEIEMNDVQCLCFQQQISKRKILWFLRWCIYLPSPLGQGRTHKRLGIFGEIAHLGFLGGWIDKNPLFPSSLALVCRDLSPPERNCPAPSERCGVTRGQTIPELRSPGHLRPKAALPPRGTLPSLGAVIGTSSGAWERKELSCRMAVCRNMPSCRGAGGEEARFCQVFSQKCIHSCVPVFGGLLYAFISCLHTQISIYFELLKFNDLYKTQSPSSRLPGSPLTAGHEAVALCCFTASYLPNRALASF